MPKPKGPEKVQRLVRNLKPIDEALSREAKRRSTPDKPVYVPELIVELCEAAYGKSPVKPVTTTPPRKIPVRRETRSVAKPLERSTCEPNFKKPKK